MLFNSYEFILLFLPVTLLVFSLLRAHCGSRSIVGWLILTSFAFYAWWNPSYLLLLSTSLALNFSLGKALVHRNVALRRAAFVSGITLNLALLGYYKYANFFADNIARVLGRESTLDRIILPLAISFFTFQQITYLVEVYRGKIAGLRFSHYCLFIIFFPHLIAGPIIRFQELVPQFLGRRFSQPSVENLSLGLSMFFFGLFKKVVIADSIAPFADPLFAAASLGKPIMFLEAWTAVLAYSFQIYFDFSGYSDMACGLARLFGIRLPLNFNSPYKARNFIDFWRRWHISLSRFLRDYVYIPLGGSRLGEARKSVNLMLTMLLGGIWHGAGWSFLLWGALQGLFLAGNHLLRRMVARIRPGAAPAGPFLRGASVVATFVAISFAWVVFRAETVPAAWGVLKGLTGLNGISLPASYLKSAGPIGAALQSMGVRFDGQIGGFSLFPQVPVLLFLLGWVWFLPNTYQIFRRYGPCLVDEPRAGGFGPRKFYMWRPTWPWALVVVGVAVASLLLLGRVTEFLYFQF